MLFSFPALRSTVHAKEANTDWPDKKQSGGQGRELRHMRLFDKDLGGIALISDKTFSPRNLKAFQD